MRFYSNKPCVIFCNFSDGTSEILFSMSLHTLSFKNTSVTEQNMKKLFINRCVFWRRMFSFFFKFVNADGFYA